MKALMVHSENTGVAYYRSWMQAKYLRRLGWDIPELADEPKQFGPIPVEEKDRTHQPYSWESLGKGSDVLVFQRADNPEVIALALAMRDEYNAPIVFEVDDDLYDVSKNSPSYQYWYPGSPFFEIAETFMRNVDAITVSTPALQKIYSKFCDHVYVLPNCQDPEDWQVIQPKKQDKIVIGWAGSYTHYDDLKLIRRAINRIRKEYPNVVFRLIGCLPDFLDGKRRVEFRRDIVGIRDWQGKLAELNFDIGLIPVVDRPFNRGKSNIKWQEYSMLGIPTIASDVGEYRAITPNETGLLAQNEDEWYLHMKRLIEDAELRKELGRKAKQHVTKNYNIATNVGQWDQVYREIIERFKSVPRKDYIEASS